MATYRSFNIDITWEIEPRKSYLTLLKWKLWGNLGTNMEALVTHSLVTGLYDTSSCGAPPWLSTPQSSSSPQSPSSPQIIIITSKNHHHCSHNHCSQSAQDNQKNLHVSSTVRTSSNYVDQALVAHYPHAEPGFILVNIINHSYF